jgi:surface antigen
VLGFCLSAVVAGTSLLSASRASGTTPIVLGYAYGRQCPAAGYADRTDRWDMDTCNCTSYVAWALDVNGQRTGWFLPGQMDAHNWPAVARSSRIPEGTVPRVGAVAVWPNASKPWGHVAYVIAVRADGSFDVGEYNLLRRFRFDARYRLSPAGVTFIYVPRRASRHG